MKKKIPIFLTLLVLTLICVSCIATAKAEPFEFHKIPDYLNNQLVFSTDSETGLFLAGVVTSIVFLLFVLVPIVILTKGKQYTLYIIIGLSALVIPVGLGWLPVWIYIIIVLAIAVGLGRQISDAIGGLRR